MRATTLIRMTTTLMTRLFYLIVDGREVPEGFLSIHAALRFAAGRPATVFSDEGAVVYPLPLALAA